METLLTIRTLLAMMILIASQTIVSAQDTIKTSDFEILNNTKWEGFLTYKDFSSGNQRKINATMQIHLKDGKMITDVQYVYEPNKNERSKVTISKNGTFLGSEEVVSSTKENGVKTIVTKYRGKDNGKAAIQYNTYTFSARSFSKTKEVQYVDSEDRFVRHEYHYKIKNN